MSGYCEDDVNNAETCIIVKGKIMKLVIGGAYQGKCTFAAEHFNCKDTDILDGEKCTLEQLLAAKAVKNFHLFIKKLLEAEVAMQELSQNDNVDSDGKSSAALSQPALADDLPQMIAERNPQLIIISNELGYGVVPMDAFDRLWREKTGRVCTKVAQSCDEVYRVVCGIGEKLK